MIATGTELLKCMRLLFVSEKKIIENCEWFVRVGFYETSTVKGQ